MAGKKRSKYQPLILLNLLGVLIVCAAVLLFLYNGLTEPTGAATSKFSMPLNYVIEDQKTRTITLPGAPARMTATAKAFGKGRAELMLRAGDKTYYLINETIDGEKEIKQTCIDSCSFDPETPQFELEGAVYGPVVLEIYSLTFWITPESNNSAPVWKGPTLFSVTGNSVIDLDSHFFDKEGQPLTYSASQTEGVDIVIKSGKAHVQMEKGMKDVHVVAYDGVEAGMEHLKLQHQN